MNLFQFLALGAVALLFSLTLVAVWRGWITRRESATWFVIWIAAAVTLIFPRWTTSVADALGIGRGADLLLYCTVIVMMVGFLMTYVRLCRLRRDVTVLVRNLALRDAYVEDAATGDHAVPSGSAG